MTVQEIIAELTYCRGVFPSRAVEEAVRQREAVTPELLRVLRESIDNLEDIVRREDYVGHIIAMYLLAQFRERRAYPLLVEFFSADQKLVDLAMGDIITEDLGRILASVCGGDIELICEMVENADLDEYVRSAALEALVVLVASGIKTRDAITSYFRSLFHGKIERKADFVWSSLVSHSCDLHPGDMAEEIDQAFSDGLVDTMFIGPEYVSRQLEEDKESALARLENDQRNRLIEDTARELFDWPCFRPAPEPTKTLTVQDYWTAAPVRSKPKVGRNAPCPCGSGKKYKKCCGG